ncbi:metallophosphoesterase family protein [Pyrinomonas methylaliphatogenes]|jgi:exonuclease SbcD|uniref:DNA repair exonuclease n=1 Tax=Pyrinomonas methylaliphatogenes TaxID=454194 RepID=A0A0B6WZZ4_9BACT|nr:exonuclease SbcCD subunit D [Pyrinomonas methylaliphatogenes]MBX5477481.1 exonuclease SbcCD subunit D [Pyrinomonas methylaliphatogenes]CDM66853.1 DNA repair exonuclease [Pyrinomonas methylaliphatogenes]
MRFLHIADIHLGCRRYNLEERARDFFRAWYDVIERHAVPSGPDFVLIAGDLFHVRRVDPLTMNQAIAGLRLLKEAGIPVLAIEGNHDQCDALSGSSWLRSLSQWGFLKLLEPQRGEDGQMRIVAWDDEACCGSYIDIAGARIFGSNWYGMSTNAALPRLAEAIKPFISERRFNILMLHTDVEGQTNRPIPALSFARLNELKAIIDYVALGHTHRRFEFDNWAFNPGSLEACTVDEYQEERGFYLVEVDDGKGITARHIRDYVQRPIRRVWIDVSGSSGPERVRTQVLDKIQREISSSPEDGELKPIVEVTLRGRLGFRSSRLEIATLRDLIQEMTGALHVIVRNLTVPVEYQVGDSIDPSVPRHERERRILEDLIARDARYRDRAPAIAAMIMETKRLALAEAAPETIADFIAQQLEAPTEEEQRCEAHSEDDAKLRV